MKRVMFIIMLILVIAAITKPNEGSFNQYIKKELKSSAKDDLLSKFVKSVSKTQSALTTNYYDKIFFSIAETTIGNDQYKFFGICGMWFKINS